MKVTLIALLLLGQASFPPGGVAPQSGTSTLTDASATDLLLFPLADTEQVFGTIILCTECRNASNWAVTHETYDFVCINDSDTEVCAFGQFAGTAPSVNDGSGTFATHTLAGSYGTNQVTFTLDADCSLTTQTLLETTWNIDFHHGGEVKAVTVQN